MPDSPHPAADPITPAAPPPRIWRLPGLSSWSDESGHADAAATDAALAAVAARGFTGVWFFAKLPELMQNTLFPELNPPAADATRRIASLQAAVDRARRHGLDLWLYFNDPAGYPQDHPFWAAHPELRGEPQWNKYGFCTSQPAVLAFFREALESLFTRLHGVAGVILITACEDITHCWSKRAVRKGAPPPTCPRCKDREPADVIGDLLDVWCDVRRTHGLRVIAWNWEWAYYYDDPPTAIVDRVPPGVELMADLEIGGSKTQCGDEVAITEYCYSYVGPGHRFTALRELAAARHIPLHAKIQINSTHELCSVPSLPLLATLHAKHLALHDAGVSGFLGTWTIGCDADTLNTHAVQMFWSDPARFRDRAVFLQELSRRYFGDAVSPARMVQAWEAFSAAFMHLPFDIPIIYYGPHNDALARPMTLQTTGTPIGRSFMGDAPGDDFGRLYQRWTPQQVINAYGRLSRAWDEALAIYRALAEPAAANPRARREWGQAVCIGKLLQSTCLHYRFAHALTLQRAAMAGDSEWRDRPRVLDLPALPSHDLTLRQIMEMELTTCEAALPYLDADPCLGFHEEFQGYKFNAESVRAKVAKLRAELHARS